MTSRSFQESRQRSQKSRQPSARQAHEGLQNFVMPFSLRIKP
jgi:hypothetical protein